MTRDILEVEPGDKVRFLNRNGYECEPINAVSDGLVEGGIYTITGINIGGWCSELFIAEFPRRGYNTVMFEVVDVPNSDLKIYVQDHGIYGMVMVVSTDLEAAKVVMSRYPNYNPDVEVWEFEIESGMSWCNLGDM